MSGPTESVFREPAVEEILIGHLKHSGYRVVTRPHAPSGYPDIVAEGPDGKWVIEVKGEDSGGYTSAEMNFQMGLGQIMSRMTDKNIQYGLAFPWTPDFRRVLKKYKGSDSFERLSLCLFVVHRYGMVKRYGTNAIAELIREL